MVWPAPTRPLTLMVPTVVTVHHELHWKTEAVVRLSSCLLIPTTAGTIHATPNCLSRSNNAIPTSITLAQVSCSCPQPAAILSTSALINVKAALGSVED